MAHFAAEFEGTLSSTKGGGTNYVVNAMVNAPIVEDQFALRGSFSAHVYVAAKGGIISFTQALAGEYAKDNIRANAICPGSIDTPLSDSLGEETKRRFINASLLKRQGTPEEVADAVVFLVSEQSTYITGVTLNVDAGALMS